MSLSTLFDEASFCIQFPDLFRLIFIEFSSTSIHRHFQTWFVTVYTSFCLVHCLPACLLVHCVTVSQLYIIICCVALCHFSAKVHNIFSKSDISILICCLLYWNFVISFLFPLGQLVRQAKLIEVLTLSQSCLSVYLPEWPAKQKPVSGRNFKCECE